MEEQIINDLKNLLFESKAIRVQHFLSKNRWLLKNLIPEHHWDDWGEGQCIWFFADFEGINWTSPANFRFINGEGYRFECDFTANGKLGYRFELKEYELNAKFELKYVAFKHPIYWQYQTVLSSRGIS